MKNGICSVCRCHFLYVKKLYKSQFLGAFDITKVSHSGGVIQTRRWEKLIIASMDREKLLYHSANKEDTGADCVIEHLETETQEEAAQHKNEVMEAAHFF